MAPQAQSCQSSADNHSPRVQDAFVLRQLPHKARVRARYTALLLHIVVRLLQGPAEFLHRIGYDCGSRSTDTHFAMYQALGMIPPAGARVGGREESF